MSKLDRLKAVELHDVWPHEASDFTSWLAEKENLALLGETLGMDLELERKGLNVGGIHTGILCRNVAVGDARSFVLIESQLGRTDNHHFCQILMYAMGFDIYTVVWIAKEFEEVHRVAFDRLNETTNEDFQYFGIEVKLWQIEDSVCVPQFGIVSSPSDRSRAVSRDRELVVSEGTLERTIRQTTKIWIALHDHMIEKGSWLQFPIADQERISLGRSGFFVPYVGLKTKVIGIRLYLIEKNATAHFHLLKEQQAEVEKELGEPLEWEKLHNRISLCKENTDPKDATDWPNQHEWFAAKLELFYQVFRQRIKVLDAADWEPPEDDEDDD